MSNRSDILSTLKTALEGVTVANGYNTTVARVKRGLHDYADFSTYPGVSMWARHVRVDDRTGPQDEARLRVVVWGHVRCPDDDYSALDDLVADLMKLLLHEWAHAEDTHYAEEVVTWEADPASCSLAVDIVYEFDRGQP